MPQSLIVGAFFRPPAKLLLEHLPAGASLKLVPEPENPYDEHALQVWARSSDLPESEYGKLELQLPNCGHTLEEVLQTAEWWLGYAPASRNKDLLRWASQGDVMLNNEEIAKLGTVEARLTFGPSGEPRMDLEAVP
jgi:hypothetical protein